MARRFSLFEEVLSVFESQNLKDTRRLPQPFRMKSSATLPSMRRRRRRKKKKGASKQVSKDHSKEPESVASTPIWVKLQLFLRLLLLMTLQLCSLPPPLFASVSNSSCLFAQYQASCMLAIVLTTVLFKVLYCEIKNVSLFWGFVFYILFVFKLLLNLLQYCIADCVSWVPRLTLLDLWTN